MRSNIKCPYLSKNRSCSHSKRIKSNGRKMCVFNNQIKCPLYKEWVKKISNEKYLNSK